MNNEFDGLTEKLTQSVTRRAALAAEEDTMNMMNQLRTLPDPTKRKASLTLHQTSLLLLIGALALAGALVANASPVSTSFTYQGLLQNNGVLVNGPHDISVSLYSAATGPGLVGSPNPNVFTCWPVNNGLLTLALNFGGPSTYDCEARWLEFAVRPCGSTNSFQVLTQRVELLPTPYAISSLSACSVESNGVTTVSIQDGSVTASKIGAGQAVKSLNGLHDSVNLVAGANVTITPSGNDLQIAAAGAGGLGIWNLNGSSTYYNAGNVGIGTASPSKRLEVQGSGDVEIGLKSTDATFTRLWTLQSTHGEPPFSVPQPWDGSFQIIDRTAGVSRLAILASGRVGIGTLEPLSRFHSVAELGAGNAIQGSCSDTDGSAVYGEHTAQGRGVEGRSSGSGVGVLGNNINPAGWAGYFNGRVSVVGDAAVAGNLSFGAQTRQMVNFWNTAYGIGVQPYTMYFRCDGSSPDNGFAWYAGGLHDDNRLAPGFGGTNLMSLDGTGLFVRRNASVCSLTIRGGCDLAEPFQMSDEEPPKGSLVVIDDEHEGKLKLARTEYDTRVAGIVSGANGVNPGISLHQEGVIEGGQNVALSGRVYALADASNGSIKPGDLLTSSSTPGHVMKVADHTRAQGAIVGKAMSVLQQGKGMVLVLVSLQ